jgi:hypothetical protein
LSELTTAVAMVSPNCSGCQSRKTGKREEHLKTGITSRAFLCLLVSLSALCILAWVGLGRQLFVSPHQERTDATGELKWIIHNWVAQP